MSVIGRKIQALQEVSKGDTMIMESVLEVIQHSKTQYVGTHTATAFTLIPGPWVFGMRPAKARCLAEHWEQAITTGGSRDCSKSNQRVRLEDNPCRLYEIIQKLVVQLLRRITGKATKRRSPA
jgi:hypothetical protein